MPLKAFRGLHASAWSMDISPDGRWLAAGTWSGNVNFWEMSATPTRPPIYRTLDVRDIVAWAFSTDNRLVGAIADGKLKIYDAISLQLLEEPALPFTNACSVAFSTDNRFVAATTIRGRVGVWDRQDRKLISEFAAHEGRVAVVPESFLLEGQTLVTVDDDGTVKEWDFMNAKELGTRRLLPPGNQSRRDAFTVAVSPTFRLVAGACGHDIEIIKLDAPEFRLHLTGQEHVEGIAFSADGNLLGTAGPVLEVWDLQSARRVHQWGATAHSVAFSPDGRRVISGESGKAAMQVWSLDSKEKVGVLGGKGSIFHHAAFSSDGRTIGALNLNGVLHLWHAPSWNEIDAAERDAADKAILSADNWLSTERANVYARRGQWKEAATDMARALEVDPANHTPYHQLAPLLVASGDVEGYGRLCSRIQVQFAGAQDPLIAERMAKACLILPGAGVDFQPINQWVKTALTADRQGSLFRYAQFVGGLAAYRQTNHARALENARTVLDLAGTDPNPEIAAWAVMAMAKHGLKQTNEAVTALSQARELAKAKLPKLETGDLGTGWNDWIITHALLREARTLIEENGTHSPDASKAAEP
jgi:tetratricopeptide (TPR) repeat protein